MSAVLVWHSQRTPLTETEVYRNFEARHGNRTYGPFPAAMDADRARLLETRPGMEHMHVSGQLWERLAERGQR